MFQNGSVIQLLLGPLLTNLFLFLVFSGNFLLKIGDRPKYLNDARMQKVDSLSVEPSSGIKLKYIIFPIIQFLKGIAGEPNLERVLELMLNLLPERPKVEFDFVKLLPLLLH
jgi:hypothetical protein